MAVAADTSWTFEPGAIALVLVLAYVYLKRWRDVRGGPDGARGAPVRCLIAFVAADLTLVASLISPVDALAEQLFSMHMLQHVLLLDVAPVFLMLSLTRVLLRPLTRRTQALERSAGLLMHPAVAVVSYIVVMWIWHVPTFYDAALRHPLIHVGEHVCMLSVGLLYWWHLLSPIRSRMRGGPFAPVVYMLATKFFVGLLGVGLIFAQSPIYDFYKGAGRVWGLSARDDQGVAGGIMATEQSIVMGIALVYLFVKALEESEREDERAERYETTTS